jgi:hypothetical protein
VSSGTKATLKYRSDGSHSASFADRSIMVL